MNEQQLEILTFSKLPGGRKKQDGPYNAERFRTDFLVPALSGALAQNSVLSVILDGVLGYSSSFLEEVFGGLVRTKLFRNEDIKSHLKIVANNRIYESARIDAQKYLDEAMRRI